MGGAADKVVARERRQADARPQSVDAAACIASRAAPISEPPQEPVANPPAETAARGLNRGRRAARPDGPNGGE